MNESPDPFHGRGWLLWVLGVQTIGLACLGYEYGLEAVGRQFVLLTVGIAMLGGLEWTVSRRSRG